jgi:hypothetical protein
MRILMTERKVPKVVPELARLEQAAEILGHLVRADLVARLHFRLANENYSYNSVTVNTLIRYTARLKSCCLPYYRLGNEKQSYSYSKR